MALLRRKSAGPLSSLRFLQLLVFIVVGMLLLPVMGEHHLVYLVFQIVLLNGVIVAVSASDGRRWPRYVLIGVAVLGLALQALRLGRTPGDLVVSGSEAINTVVLMVCIVVILRYVLRRPVVTADTLFAAIVAYFFLALLFSRIYVLIQAHAPGSFGPLEAADTELELVYFSFVTIATLGYGDILPRTATAQMVAVLEAVTGQMYVAVLVAWLVSAYVAGRERERQR